MKQWARRLALLVLLPAVAVAAEAPLPDAFKAAKAIAEDCLRNPSLAQYRTSVFYPRFSLMLQVNSKECFTELPSASHDPFVMIITVNDKGRIAAVDTDKITNLSGCLSGKLKGGMLAPPPVTPYAEKINMALK